MADSTFEVTAPNLQAFDAALAGLAADLSDLAAPTAAVARSTVVAAASAAPRLSGQLASAHRAGPGWHKGAAGITVATAYAAPQHWGWRAHGIARRPWIVAFWRRDGGWPAKFNEDLQAIIDKEAART
jgi:hypothetical protein